MGKRVANGQGYIRQRSDGRWECQISTPDGKRKSVYGKTQKEVRVRMVEIQASIDNGLYQEPTRMTFGEWLDIWQAEYLNGIKESTRLTYQQHVNNHLRPAMGKVKLSALTAHKYQQFINDLSRVKHLSAKTVKNIHSTGHEALKRTRKLGYIKINPAADCDLPRMEKAKSESLDVPEIKTLLNVLDDGLYSTVIKVDIFTGMREGEILGLQWSCVNFEDGTITVNKQLCRPRTKGAAYQLASTKTDNVRTINPPAYVMSLLKQQRQRQLEQRLKAGSLWDDHGFPDLCFTYEDGKHLCYNVILRALRKALREAGLSDKRFHDLRHTYATTCLRNGDDLRTVQHNLGHRDASFTLKMYAHCTQTMRQDSSQRMDHFISEITV